MKLIPAGLGVMYMLLDPLDTQEINQAAANVRYIDAKLNGKTIRWKQVATVPSIATQSFFPTMQDYDDLLAAADAVDAGGHLYVGAPIHRPRKGRIMAAAGSMREAAQAQHRKREPKATIGRKPYLAYLRQERRAMKKVMGDNPIGLAVAEQITTPRR